MIRTFIIAAVAFLAACSGISGTVATDAQIALNSLGDACKLGGPVAGALAATQDKTAASYLTYFASVCNPATGTALPGVQPDGNTGIWAAAIVGALKTYAATPAAS